MRVNEAIGQIAEIHDHLARAEQYRGFHPLAVAGSGLVGLAAAVVQPWLVPADDPAAFVRFWLVVAAVGGGVGVSRAVDAYLRHEDEFARRRTRRVVGQFLPCVAAGLGVTLALGRAGGDVVAFLPGLWAVLFGLGVFAARPYLPRAIGWVGLSYLAAGAALLAAAPAELVRAGWALGLVFAAGQVATAVVLRRNRERDANV
jgi:hypothetical protein